MNLASIDFFLFIAIFFIIYRLNAQNITCSRSQWLFIIASVVFYSVAGLCSLLVILISILLNFVFLYFLHNRIRASWMFAACVSINLCILSFFKYNSFLASVLNDIGFAFDVSALAFPLGMSFYLFQQISFAVDLERGLIETFSFREYVLYVLFFPQLIAGPIVRFPQFAEQIRRRHSLTFDYLSAYRGLVLFSVGLAKKVLIADQFSEVVAVVFDAPIPPHFFQSWAVTLLYTFQIYFDFSGYTDMARGLGLLFGVTLPLNFDSPYRATSLQSFWRRWHMSMSFFFRDYVYIPLGGGRASTPRVLSNVMITFALVGIWHGNGTTFLLWGVLHGIGLSVNRFGSLFRYLPRALAWGLTFLFVNLCWVLFRADSIATAMRIFKGMVGLNGIVLHPGLAKFNLPFSSVHYGEMLAGANGKMTLCMALLCFVLVFLPKNSNAIDNINPSFLTSTFVFIIGVVSFFSISQNNPFLYFNF